jgi:DNA polymerase III alpha subunit (gram-positive type)
MEVMLDLETLSTRGHACIAVIAAVKFSRTGKIDKVDNFYAKIQQTSCENLGLHVDPKTIQWWKEQDEKIQKEIFDKPREDLKNVLYRFKEWFGNSKIIWSHGATFDIPILAEAYSRCDLEPPWKFWNSRDTRTLFDITGIKSDDLPKENIHHALFDCYRQIWGVQEAFKRIK